MLENIPESASESLKFVATCLAAIGGAKAWFHRALAQKLTIETYEVDKKVIALENKDQLDTALDPVNKNITEIKINLKHFFERQGMKYHTEDE
jgi:hypothetical protein